MHNYKELKLWHKAIDLVVDVYKATADFPKEEKYGLISQMRRCAVSIASNIAEGAGRNSNKEFCHFLANANGSTFELETQIVLDERLSLLKTEVSNDLSKKTIEVSKMNFSLQQKVNPDMSHFGKLN